MLAQTQFTPSADWKYRTSQEHELFISTRCGRSSTNLELEAIPWIQCFHGNEGVQTDDGVEESIDVNTHWGPYGFSLSLFLPRTGLTAHKTSQHHLDAAVDGFIPVHPASDIH